ncbi:hypothetical protein [Nitrosomonas aestuarii]|uniref:hypothetical protein n=1 Tax=Nitrosomonas aestuarii TaxID=52441 RepID=UPI000D3156B8|nr:hypothetical protein [Nitrosomonas aestuarii]PTN08095.1 hypothetical protein C8R11_1302 [Nitrosomonas aestuarii]
MEIITIITLLLTFFGTVAAILVVPEVRNALKLRNAATAPVISINSENPESIFEEEFENNNNSWELTNNNQISMEITKSKLLLVNKKDSTQHGFKRIDLPVTVKTNLTYLKYEVTFRKVEDGGFPFLLLFGEGHEDTYAFGIVKNLYIYGRASTTDWEETIINYTESSHIKSDGRLNKMDILIQGSELNFIINNELVDKTTNEHSFGDKLGLLLGPGDSVEVYRIFVSTKE